MRGMAINHRMAGMVSKITRRLASQRKIGIARQRISGLANQRKSRLTIQIMRE